MALFTVVVLRVCWTSYKDCFRAVPRVASGERCAAPDVARGDRRAALDAVSYRTLLERLVRQWLVLEPLALEQLVSERLAVPVHQHLTSLAR
jgi:hypothetical protein